MRTVPRTACINDLTAYGRCSLSTVLPILSVMGVQPCAIPSAILSKHTGFSDYRFVDFTPWLGDFFGNLADIDFDVIYTGFIGSEKQLELVRSFIKSKPDAKVIVDPVMGDGGKLYSTYNENMCIGMKRLAACADIITPNVTEACFLAGVPYKGEELDEREARELALCLNALGMKAVVITGIKKGDLIMNLTLDKGSFTFDEIHRLGRVFSGTGDIFASIVAAGIAKNKSLSDTVRLAGSFISDAVRLTTAMNTPSDEGVLFEPILYKLCEV